MDKFRVNDAVMIPRTGGGYSKGEIIAIYQEAAKVCFPVGKTYQGQPNADIPEDAMATKTVPLAALLTLEEYQEMEAK